MLQPIQPKGETTNWINLENDDAHKTHFSNGQCFVGVTFSHASINNITPGAYEISYTLPIYPEDVNFGNTTTYSDVSVLGRPGTIGGYVGTSDVTTNFSFHLHREIQNINYTGTRDSLNLNRNMIDELVAFMQACSYPSNENGLLIPIVTYKFGDTIFTGTQTSCKAQWTGPKINNVYMECKMDISITHRPDKILYFDIVRASNPRQFR